MLYGVFLLCVLCVVPIGMFDYVMIFCVFTSHFFRNKKAKKIGTSF